MNTCKKAGPVFRSSGCVVMEQQQGPDPEEVALKEMQEKALKDSREKLQAEVEQLRQEQHSKCRRCEQEMETVLEHLEREIKQQLIPMSIRIAELILGRELPDARNLRTLIDDALSPISNLQGVRVRMAPGSIQLLESVDMPELSDQKIDFVEDNELQPGDVVVESRNGIFDGRLRSRLDHLAETLSKPVSPEQKIA